MGEQAVIDSERMEYVMRQSLSSGGHDSIGDGMCVVEAVSYIAGEPWTDSPRCVCPVIAAFLRNWNDSLPSDAERDRLLKPLIQVIVGTRSTPEVEHRRATMAADWLIRVQTPAWLRAAKLEQQAAALEALPEITDSALCTSLMPTLQAVRSDAAAAWDAAWAAAGGAAGGAARAAARAAAGDAAWDAAGAAAWDAAWAAARAAAWDAAGDALAPVVTRLQASASDLVRAMAEVRS